MRKHLLQDRLNSEAYASELRRSWSKYYIVTGSCYNNLIGLKLIFALTYFTVRYGMYSKVIKHIPPRHKRCHAWMNVNQYAIYKIRMYII